MTSTSTAVKPKPTDTVWDNVKTILYALLLAMVIRFAFVQPFRIPSGSMQPTLVVGDYIVVSKWSYGYSRFSAVPLEGLLPGGRLFGSTPKQGDIVVFRAPGQPDKDFVKRLVGMPGDRVQMKGGVLHLNGEPVGMESLGVRPFTEQDGSITGIQTYQETLPNGVSHIVFDRYAERDGNCLDAFGSNGCRYDDTEEVLVPAGHYFMMGDDRDFSADSRTPEMGFIPHDHLVGKARFVFVSFDHTTKIWLPWTLFTGFRGDRFAKGVE